jgi:hypothetical protein
MRFKITAVAFLVVLTVIGLVAMSPMTTATASTTSTTSAATSSSTTQTGVTGVGQGTRVLTAQALYQCPFTTCNQGRAYPGQDLATICYIVTDRRWDWIFNHVNWHTGYVPSSALTVRSSQPCSTVGIGTGVFTPQALYQCPFTTCNQGRAYPGQDIATVCFIITDRRWDLVHNHVNWHVGFVPSSQLIRISGTGC